MDQQRSEGLCRVIPGLIRLVHLSGHTTWLTQLANPRPHPDPSRRHPSPNSSLPGEQWGRACTQQQALRDKAGAEPAFLRGFFQTPEVLLPPWTGGRRREESPGELPWPKSLHMDLDGVMTAHTARWTEALSRTSETVSRWKASGRVGWNANIIDKSLVSFIFQEPSTPSKIGTKGL